MHLFSDWLHSLFGPAHAGEWINGATGAGGAILGSLVTIIWTASYNHSTRIRERREKFAAGAFASYQRLNQIYSVAMKIRDHLDNGLFEAQKRNQPTCSATMGMQRMSSPVVFPIEELWTLTQVSDNKLINRVNSLDHSFNHLQDAVQTYSILRQEVWSKFPIPDTMDGIVGSVGLTEQKMRKLAPDIASLDHILSQLRPIARSIVEDTFDALTLLVHAKAHPLGKKFKVTPPGPNGDAVSISAEDVPKRHWWQRSPTAPSACP